VSNRPVGDLVEQTTHAVLTQSRSTARLGESKSTMSASGSPERCHRPGETVARGFEIEVRPLPMTLCGPDSYCDLAEELSTLPTFP
jgi:hypothetical protein